MSHEVHLTCPSCDSEVPPEGLLSGVQGYSNETDSGVAPCTRCGKAIEFRVRAGSLEIGYTYWAGSLHFEGMVGVSVPGLRWERGGRGRVIEYGGSRFLIP